MMVHTEDQAVHPPDGPWKSSSGLVGSGLRIGLFRGYAFARNQVPNRTPQTVYTQLAGNLYLPTRMRPNLQLTAPIRIVLFVSLLINWLIL